MELPNTQLHPRTAKQLRKSDERSIMSKENLYEELLNHWLDQPTASLGWIVESAAGHPLR